jgi:hypothetical protein
MSLEMNETATESAAPAEHNHHHHSVEIVLDSVPVTSPSRRRSGMQIRELGPKDRVHGFKTEIVTGHVRVVGDDEEIDLEVRTVEFHFWTWSKEHAAGLARALEDRRFLVALKHAAASSSDPSVWNVEATIKQSIDLTLRHEFTDELVHVAAEFSGRYDGWGLRI